MKGTYWIAAALICFVGCGNCGDNNVAGNNVNNANNANNANNSNNSNNANNSNNTNNTSNNPNSVTNNVPMECTPEFEYDEWAVNTDRRLIKACSPYVIESDVEVSEGALLLIDPGVELQMDGGTWIRIGEGRIEADGTADDPIVFTSSSGSPGKGSWRGLRFGSQMENGNSITNAVIEYGGQEGFGQAACVTIDNDAGSGRMTFTDVLLRECEQAGLSVESAVFTEIARLTFEEMDLGMILDGDVIGQVAEGFEYVNVGANAVGNGDITESATWVAQDIPYRATSSLELQGDNDPTLTIQAGFTVQFNNSTWLRVGNSLDGGLIINGTPEDPVVFESAAGTPAAGDWRGVYFGANVLGGTQISNVTIRHGGQEEFGAQGCVTIAATSAGRISIDDSIFEECAVAGVAALREAFQFDSFTGNTFRDMDIGMHISPNAVSSVGPQNYDATGANRIENGALTEAGTWVSQEIPYRVAGAVEVQGDNAPVLTIEGPNTIQFSNNWMRVGNSMEGGLIVQGTMADPVVFQSTSAVPGPADWRGIYFANNALAGSTLDFAVVEHCGLNDFGTAGCVTLAGNARGRVTITNSTFNECDQACIANTGDDFEFAEVSGNTFRNSVVGMRLHANAVGQVIDSQTYDAVASNEIVDSVLDDSATWVSQSIPWVVTSNIDVGNDTNQAILTIETPNEFRFVAGWLRVGNSEAGGLVINGTAADPVVFTSTATNPSAGDWRGIRLNGSTLNGTLLNYLDLSYGGDNAFGQNGGLHIQDTGTSVTVSNSTFSNNAQTDIWVDSDSTPTLTNNTGTVTNQ